MLCSQRKSKIYDILLLLVRWYLWCWWPNILFVLKILFFYLLHGQALFFKGSSNNFCLYALWINPSLKKKNKNLIIIFRKSYKKRNLVVRSPFPYVSYGILYSLYLPPQGKVVKNSWQRALSILERGWVKWIVLSVYVDESRTSVILKNIFWGTWLHLFHLQMLLTDYNQKNT